MPSGCGSWDGRLVRTNHDKEPSLLSLTSGRKALIGGAAALLAALAVSAPANAATMVESSGSAADETSFNYSYSWGATALNFTQPGDTALNFARKAGG
jgi:hypothetical protein